MYLEKNKVEFFNSILSKASQEEKQEAIQHYFQQLWQMDNIIVLLGSGFTRAVNGPLMSDLSEEILPKIILQGIEKLKENQQEIESWKLLWNLDVSIFKELNSLNAKYSSDDISSLKEHCKKINIEDKINELQSICSACIYLGHDVKIYRESLTKIKNAIIDRISSITPHIGEDNFHLFIDKLQPYRSFFKRLIKYRRPQQPRIKVFTSNYDTVIEAVCDIEGIHCVTGFEGKTFRTLNPTVFDLDLNFKGTGQSSIYYANVIHLYKLHGSVDWRMVKIDGVDEILQGEKEGGEVLIYPCYAKFAETLEAPYYEMFRRFGDASSQTQTVLLSIGYGFYDDHINQMILRAYKNPSCQLLLCEPRITENENNFSDFIKHMKKLAMPEPDDQISDPRITILGGKGVYFPEILSTLFPPIEIESPSEEIKKFIQKLIKMGQE